MASLLPTCWGSMHRESTVIANRRSPPATGSASAPVEASPEPPPDAPEEQAASSRAVVARVAAAAGRAPRRRVGVVIGAPGVGWVGGRSGAVGGVAEGQPE